MNDRAAARGGWDINTMVSNRATSPRPERRNGSPDLLRATPHPRDGRLDALALRWLASFPNGSRPSALGERFPRIANRLALCWADPGLASQVLNDLLLDRRGGRQGFPKDVRVELLALQERAEALRRRLQSQRTSPLALVPMPMD